MSSALARFSRNSRDDQYSSRDRPNFGDDKSGSSCFSGNGRGRCLLFSTNALVMIFAFAIFIHGAVGVKEGRTAAVSWATQVNLTGINATGSQWIVHNNNSNATFFVVGSYNLYDPYKVMLAVGALVLANSMLGCVGIWASRKCSCGSFLCMFALVSVVLATVMIWFALFCFAAQRSSDQFVQNYWSYYKATLPDPNLPKEAWVHRADKNMNAQNAGGLCFFTALLMLLTVYGTARALGHLVAATAVLKGMSVVMFVLGSAAIGLVAWAAESDYQYGGDWAPALVGTVAALLVVSALVGCYGMKSLSSRIMCFHLLLATVLLGLGVLITIVVLSLTEADDAPAEITGEGGVQLKLPPGVESKVHADIIGDENYDKVLNYAADNVNIVGLCSAVLSMALLCNWLASMYYCRLSRTLDYEGDEEQEIELLVE